MSLDIETSAIHRCNVFDHNFRVLADAPWENLGSEDQNIISVNAEWSTAQKKMQYIAAKKANHGHSEVTSNPSAVPSFTFWTTDAPTQQQWSF